MQRRIIVIGWAIIIATMLVSCIKTDRENVRPVAMGIQGPEWQLVEVGGTPVSPLSGDQRPFISFDAVKNEATGFGGCNNFFGGYDLHGSSLRFGPVGTTRRFCEGEAGEVELRFMQALEKTRSWIIRDGVLLLKDGEVLARFTITRGENTAVDLESMTFLSSRFPSGKVTLSRGEYREKAAPGSAAEKVVRLSNKRVFGLINGKETGAVVLITETGGSGTFFDLALLEKDAAGWVNTDVVKLGDRVEVHAIGMDGDTIVVRLKTHGPEEPMCCPTYEVTKRFVVQENRLVPSESEKPEKNYRHEIIDTVWQWLQTLYNDDRMVKPADPENYTVQFREDNTLSVKADCNQKGGTYTFLPEEKRLAIEITHSTMAACPEGSLEDEFVRGLSGSAVYFIKDGDLFIDLKYDSGTMRFSRKHQK
jgi:heat shock protein HslJ